MTRLRKAALVASAVFRSEIRPALLAEKHGGFSIQRSLLVPEIKDFWRSTHNDCPLSRRDDPPAEGSATRLDEDPNKSYLVKARARSR